MEYKCKVGIGKKVFESKDNNVMMDESKWFLISGSSQGSGKVRFSVWKIKNCSLH